jgi:Glycosyl transferases, related to UDP-glucuronosyltransferase
MLKPLDYRLVTDNSLSADIKNEDDWVHYNNKQKEDFDHSEFQLYYKQVLKEANLLEDVIHISKVNRVGYFKVKDVEEIILFPKEFDVERDNYSGINYIGPFIYEDRDQESIDWSKLNIQNRPIVYCAMGSLTNTFKDKNIFFKKIISAFSELKDFFLILVSGPDNDELLINNAGENVYICEFAPQINILKESSLFITHGGAGSVKESIKFGVPMLVYPWKTKSDMYGNADRLEFHKIGQLGDISLDSIQTIKDRIIDVHTDQIIKLNLSKMQNIFLEYERNEKQYLENIIASI